MDLLSPTTATIKINTPLRSPFTHFHTNQPPSSILSLPHPRRPSLQLIHLPPSAPRFRRCLAASPGPPPSDPHPQQDPIQLSGFSRLQDRIQIFLAVLFWMSLFFWASAFDKRNNGRRNRGSRFRR
ncbi:uncharacterized protein LOC123210579 [Mangifera indica]|uniref:uncharacterized protein LOC123210579 n=1 Tax=Mangifera indica TaxID=29780 RepID=UPI001CF9D171|nr:uncharacterized protein LOC123210579 [Mangifera indica]